MTFKELAIRTYNGDLPLGDATFMIESWFVLAAEKIKERTGEEIDSELIALDFHSSLSNVGIMWSCGDDDDEINIPEAGEEIDRIVQEMVHDIVTRQTIKNIEAERERSKPVPTAEEEPDIIQTSQGFAPNYDKFDALGMTTEEALVWCNMD